MATPETQANVNFIRVKTQSSTPATPASGYSVFYDKDKSPHFKDSDGNIKIINYQTYEQVLLSGDQSVSTIADLTGMTITKTLDDGVWYRWRFFWTGVKTTAGVLSIIIADGSDTQKQKNTIFLGGLEDHTGTIEFIEQGAGASVTRKVRASCDVGSFNFDIATGQTIVFYAERCG